MKTKDSDSGVFKNVILKPVSAKYDNIHLEVKNILVD